MAEELRFVMNANSPVEPDFLAGVGKLLRLPRQAQLQLAGVHAEPEGACSIEYRVVVPVRLEGPEYGIADGATVDEQSSVRLSFDVRGKLLSSHFNGIDDRRVALVRDQVKKLAAQGQIASTRPEASSQAKPWYIEQDPQGIKRLKRAQMA